MIKIQINYGNEKFLDSQENLSFSVELNNPIFGTVGDSIKSYSYPFTLPRTPNNDILLEFPTFINNPKKWIAKKATVFVDGIIVLEGDLVIMGATNNSVSIAIQVNQKLEWLSTRKMTELTELGYVWQSLSANWSCELLLQNRNGWSNISTQTLTINVTGKIYEIPFVFFPGLIPNINQTLQNLVNVINADTANNNALATVIGGTFSNLRISRVDTSKDFYVIPTASNDDTSSYAFEFSVENPTLHNGTTNAFINTVMSNTASYIYRYPELVLMLDDDSTNAVAMNEFTGGGRDNSGLNITSPQIKVKQGLELLLSKFGYKLQSNFLDELDLEELLFCNNNSNAPQTYDLSIPLGTDKVKHYPEYFFMLKDKFPDMTLLAWLENFAKMFCLYVQFDHKSKTLSIESLNPVMISSNIKEYECNESYSIDKKENTNNGYTFSLAKPTPRTKYKPIFDKINIKNYSNLVTGLGTTKVETKISFPDYRYSDLGVQDALPGFFGGWWSSLPNYDKIPVKDYGTSDISTQWGQKGNANKANMLVFYKGFFAGKPVSDFSAANETLVWGVVDATNTFGLYNRRWRRFVNFMNRTEPVKRKIYMYLKDFANLDLSQKIRVDNQTYFIKKCRLQFSHSTKLKIVVECDLLVV